MEGARLKRESVGTERMFGEGQGAGIYLMLHTRKVNYEEN